MSQRPFGDKMPRNTLPSFSSILRKKFRLQHDVRKFILSALAQRDKDGIIRQLALPQGLQKLSEITSLRFTREAGNLGKQYSFQRIAVPLCHLLSLEDIRCSVRKMDVVSIYEKVFESKTFFLSYANHVLTILNDGESVKDPLLPSTVETEYRPANVFEIIAPFITMCHSIISKITEARSSELWAAIVPDIHSSTMSFINESGDISSECRDTVNRLDMLAEIVERFQNYSKRTILTSRNTPTVASGREIELYMRQAPGALCATGPRHENDKINITDIQVIPLQSEITCLSIPYLPYQSGPLAHVSSHWIPDDVDRHLDVQFRLVREDMIAPLRQAIQHFFLAHVKRHSEKKMHQFRFPTGGNSEGTCLLFRNLLVNEVDVNPRDGLTFVVSFDQVSEASSGSARQSEWDQGRASRWLQPESLVCVAFGVRYSKIEDHEREGGHVPSPHMTTSNEQIERVNLRGARLVFATVTYEGRDLLGKDRDRCQSLHIRLENSEETTEMLLRVGKKDGEGGTNVLLQVRGHFIAGLKPVLLSLQEKEIRHLSWMQHISRTRRLVSGSNVSSNSWVDGNGFGPPEYIKEDTRYDLTFLVKGNKKDVNHILSRVNVTDIETCREILFNVQDDIILDPSQILFLIRVRLKHLLADCYERLR